MEADALHQLCMVRRMQFLIRFFPWSVCHATEGTCAAVETCLQSEIFTFRAYLRHWPTWICIWMAVRCC